jgi:NADP-dependent 3-hydroxy acid dehydrogenase YdfG
MDLQGRTVVVTGASAGIGAATARVLSAAGARLVLTSRRRDRLDGLAAELSTESVVLAADIADPATPGQLLDLAVERFGRADALINNAGQLVVGSIDDIDLEALTGLIRTNYEAVVRSTYLFAKAFKAQGSGAIVNVSSIGAHMSPSKWGVYSGLKRALEAFTDALRVELAGTGVKLGFIAPGSTATDIFDSLRPDPSWKDKALDAEDVAQAIRFMLEQPDRANIAGLLIYSANEKA